MSQIKLKRMNNNSLNLSNNEITIESHNKDNSYNMINFICVSSNTNNNHLISITNTCSNQGKLSSLSNYNSQSFESTPKLLKQFSTNLTDQTSINNQPTKDNSSSKFGLPRQRSFDQGGEGRLSSSQVKQKLKECVLNKKNNKINKSPLTGPSPQNSFESEETHNNSTSSNYQPNNVMSSYPLPSNEVLSISKEDFPIRKTSSLPNLKVRSALKQKALDRRPSPLSNKRSKICSNNSSVSKTTVSGLTGYSQSSTMNTASNSQNNTFVQNQDVSSTNINFSKYQPHLYDTDNGQQFPLNVLGSNHFKSLNLTPQVDFYQSTFPSYQLPLQALFDSQPQLVPSFTSLPNLNLAHSLSAILSANKTCGSVIDFNKLNQTMEQHNSGDAKEMDSSCSQSPDVVLEQNSNTSPLSPSTTKSVTYGYSPRRMNNSGIGAACRQRTQRVLNRTNSAPLPLGNNNNSAVSAVQLAMQEQKLLFVKAQLRQKVLDRSNCGKSNSEDYQMITDRSSDFDWQNVCTRTLSDSLISSDSVPKRSLSLEESSSEIELGQQLSSCPYSPDGIKTNNLFQFRMLPNHSTNSGFSMQTTNSSSITKLPSPILEEKILENPHTTAIVYDVGMLSHRCLCGNEDIHPESSKRLSTVWERLKESQIVGRCHIIQGKKASMDDLQLCHEDTYSVLFGTNPANRLKINPQLLMSVEFCRLPCGGIGVDIDTVWNNAHTANAARLAVGCVVELTLKIVRGELRNGFALVRPPGHNAEFNQAMGFGYFNSVAIAAKKVTMQTAVKRVLILDWDIHHGNGTQQIFYNDPSVLYISLHRHDNGHFFPGTGLIEEIGEGAGTNYNINIAWKSATDALFTSMADAEYMAAFVHIVLPVAKEFNPDLILVSAGFDATKPHSSSLGGYSVSPACFGWMTQRLILSGLAEGRIVLALEGGYNIGSLCDSVEVCMKTLVKPEVLNFTDCDSKQVIEIDQKMCIPQSELNRVPKDEAIETLFVVSQLHKKKWQCFRYLSKDSMKHSYNEFVKMIACNKIYDSIPLLAMAELTVQHEQRCNSRHEFNQNIDFPMTSLRPTIPQSEPMDQEFN